MLVGVNVKISKSRSQDVEGTTLDFNLSSFETVQGEVVGSAFSGLHGWATKIVNILDNKHLQPFDSGG